MQTCSSWSWQIKAFLVFIAIAVFVYVTGVYQHIDFSWLRISSDELHKTIETSYWKSVLLYIGSLTAVIALCLPAVIPVVIASGYLFGLILGAVYSVIATVLGSLVPFVVVRYVAGSYIKEHYHERLEAFNRSVNTYGASYILILHYLAIVPFFIINTFAALTDMSVLTFVKMTALGTLPVYLIYTFAGRELSEIRTPSDLFTFPVMSSLVLLVLLSLSPMVVRRIKRYYEQKKNRQESLDRPR